MERKCPIYASDAEKLGGFMHKTSFKKIEAFRDKYLNKDDELQIVDICGLTKDESCDFIFNEENWDYKTVNVARDGHLEYEIEDNSVDVVIIGQNLERVYYFWVLLSEISRIIKPGGYLCAIVSSSGAFGMKGDFYRFHPDSLTSLAKLIGLNAISCEIDPMNAWRDSTLIAKK